MAFNVGPYEALIAGSPELVSVIGAFLGGRTDDRWFPKLLEVSGALYNRYRVDAWLTWTLYRRFVDRQFGVLRERAEDLQLRIFFRDVMADSWERVGVRPNLVWPQ